MGYLNRKLLTLFSAASLLLFSVVSWAASSTSQTTPPTTSASKTSYLFIQEAKFGELIATSNDQSTYKLVVRGLQPYVMYFTDRPARQAGLMPTATFFEQWNKGAVFQQVAPNAGLIGAKLHTFSNEKLDNEFALTLSSPVYNAKNQTVIYDAKIISSTTNLPKKIGLSHLVLFFDDSDFCPTCIHE